MSKAVAHPTAESNTATDSAAVTLFVQRAQQADVTFHLDGERREAINRICALLGGMPLAIELAASWVRVLAPSEILEEMSRSIDFLEANRRDLPPRHRSMRAVFNRSWALLGEREQQTLRRVAILRASFSRGCARHRRRSLGEISTLVAKSLLIHGGAATGNQSSSRSTANPAALSGAIVRMKWCAKFPREHLELAGEVHSTHQRMLDYYLDFAEKGYAAAHGQGYVRWIETLNNELDNLRLALEWGFVNDVHKALQLFCALRMLWEQRSADEASEWMTRAINLGEQTPEISDEIRARLLGMAAWVDRDHRQAAQRAAQSVALARTVNNERLVATVLPLLGHAAIREGRPLEAEAFFEEALAIAIQLGNGALEANVRNEIGKADRYLAKLCPRQGTPCARPGTGARCAASHAAGRCLAQPELDRHAHRRLSASASVD